LGDWDRLVDDLLPTIESMLSDREPPYFTAHSYGAAAFALDDRGDPRAPRVIEQIRELAGADHRLSLVTAGWLAWIHAHRGERQEALEIIADIWALPLGVMRPHT